MINNFYDTFKELLGYEISKVKVLDKGKTFSILYGDFLKDESLSFEISFNPYSGNEAHLSFAAFCLLGRELEIEETKDGSFIGLYFSFLSKPPKPASTRIEAIRNSIFKILENTKEN